MTKLPINEYCQRRDKLKAQIGEDAVVIVICATEKTRNSDCMYTYRQDSDFYYLTGFNEPQSLLVIAPKYKHGDSILFCKKRNKLTEIWNGRLAGPEGAKKHYKMDVAYTYDELDTIMPDILDGRKSIYMMLGKNHDFDKKLFGWIQNLKQQERKDKKAPSSILALDDILHEMRLIKSPNEIMLIRKACDISVEAHRLAMLGANTCEYEYQLEATITSEFIHKGCKSSAYNMIVASGDNACILHYTENDALIEKDKLILIDAGCELDCYAADITRTFPINGKFSSEQKALYNLVLRAQEEAISVISPKHRWNEFHDTTVKVLTNGLIKLGILNGDLKTLIKEKSYIDYFMHGTGHFLGMDVHDVGRHKKENNWRYFEPGMVLTVEPGLYIASNNNNVDKKWRGIGIRIEDNILVTTNGCEVLTKALEKGINDVEMLMTNTPTQ